MKKLISISLALFFVLTLGVVNAQEAKASEGTAIAAAEEATPATAAEMAAMTDEELKNYLSKCTPKQFAQAVAIANESGNRVLVRRVLLIANKILEGNFDSDVLVALDKITIPPSPQPKSGTSTINGISMGVVNKN